MGKGGGGGGFLKGVFTPLQTMTGIGVFWLHCTKWQ